MLYFFHCWWCNFISLSSLQWCSPGLCPFTHTISTLHQWSSQLYVIPYSCFCRWFNIAHFSIFYFPCSLADCSDSQTFMASNIASDLEKISEWGTQNLVKVNASRTQFLPISLSTNSSDPQILFEDSSIEPLSSINILGVQISSNLSWKLILIKLISMHPRN